jgi:glycosyltransferase involved in cell wall biosynthesis
MLRRIGILLVVEPRAGGMFQYACSLLDALAALPRDKYEIVVAFAGEAWRPIVARYPFTSSQLVASRFGIAMSQAIMVAMMPAALTRLASELLNPISWQLRRRHCDMWIFPAQDALGYQVRVNGLVAVHDLMHRYEPHFPEVVRGLRFRVREHRFRNLARLSRGVLVDSEVGRRHVAESYGVEPSKIHPLPYVSTRPPHEPDNAPSVFEASFKLPRKFIFYPAQFWAHKNHERLITAAAEARQNCPDLHLVLTGGNGARRDELIAHAYKVGMADRVVFAGYVRDSDLAGFYQRARAMVMPTFFGPTNIPPLEALSFGCPVAVSRIYAMPEQLGDAALYFDPNSVQEMSQVLVRLWNDDDLCNELRVRGQQRLDSWTPVHFAARLGTIIDALLDGDHLTDAR